MLILVLDDDSNRHDLFSQWFQDHTSLHVYTARSAIDALKSNLQFDLVCLDHDLDICSIHDLETTGTGLEVAKHIGNMAKDKPKKVWIHSQNEYGAESMAEAAYALSTGVNNIYLARFNPDATYGKMVLNFLEAA